MMYKAEKGINCTKPCSMYKMRKWPKVSESEQSTLVTIKFHELIAVSKDQFSYIWLNLIAQVGGYVGLFLGFSVFQITDMMDLIIQKRFRLDK